MIHYKIWKCHQVAGKAHATALHDLLVWSSLYKLGSSAETWLEQTIKVSPEASRVGVLHYLIGPAAAQVKKRVGQVLGAAGSTTYW